MANAFIFFMFLLFILAVVVRDDFIFTVLYLFAGVFIVGEIWMRKSMQAVNFRRSMPERVFLNEEIPVTLEIANKGVLPVAWLKITEGLPVDLAAHKFFRQVVSLSPFETKEFKFTIQARKRGYYEIGPLQAVSGDLLGLLADQRREGEVSSLVVYPKIVPLTRIVLPSRSPMGALRHNQPVFEDPSRVLSKRDYVSGDSMRRIDWKSSAAAGKMQVKQFEPSIALETEIFLNMQSEDYDLRQRFDVPELAVTTAASIANWIISQKQSTGLVTNGLDPYPPGGEPASPDSKAVLTRIGSIPPRKGRGHLMRILDSLARVQPGAAEPFVELFSREVRSLSWGTTLIVITPKAEKDLFDALFQARRDGMNAILVLIGPSSKSKETQDTAAKFKIPFYSVAYEWDLAQWKSRPH